GGTLRQRKDRGQGVLLWRREQADAVGEVGRAGLGDFLAVPVGIRHVHAATASLRPGPARVRTNAHVRSTAEGRGRRDSTSNRTRTMASRALRPPATKAAMANPPRPPRSRATGAPPPSSARARSTSTAMRRRKAGDG